MYVKAGYRIRLGTHGVPYLSSSSRIKRIKLFKPRVPLQTILETVNQPDNEVDVIKPSGVDDDHSSNTDVYMNPKHEDRASSFFAQPGVLAGELPFQPFFSFASRG